jgi:hypothetical protein
MQFSSSNGKNDIRCKRFDRLNSNKKTMWNGIKDVRPDIVSILNGNILLGDE